MHRGYCTTLLHYWKSSKLLKPQNLGRLTVTHRLELGGKALVSQSNQSQRQSKWVPWWVLKDGKLFCGACREELSLRKNTITNHLSCKKHETNKEKLSTNKSTEKDIWGFMMLNTTLLVKHCLWINACTGSRSWRPFCMLLFLWQNWRYARGECLMINWQTPYEWPNTLPMFSRTRWHQHRDLWATHICHLSMAQPDWRKLWLLLSGLLMTLLQYSSD